MLPTLIPLLASCVPLAFVLAALFAPRVAPLRRASHASALALLLALVVALATLVSGEVVPTRWIWLDTASAVMLVLVCVLAQVIVHFSRSYLARDPGERRYARALLVALASVTTVVMAGDLLVVAAAWMTTGMALQPLLTHFPERRAARIAAHEKFLLSRLGDLCMLGALLLLGLAVGSLELAAVLAWAQARGELPLLAHAATLLLVIAVWLKSAQLPVHGWLTRVMEAPTPVSALLHAGVVNLGGFVLIRLAPLLDHAPLARLLLVAVGVTSMVGGGLVMATRASVKSTLAWSTIAQLGFMLAQCGLGLWHLALLHLVAHSLYKAHAFLRSSSRVEVWRSESLLPAAPTSLARVLGCAALALAAVALVDHLAGGVLGPLVVVLALGLAPMLERASRRGARVLALALLGAAGIVLLTLVWHRLAALSLVSAGVPTSLWSMLGWGVLLAGFVLLFVVASVLQTRPEGTLATLLRPHLAAGLYLGDRFTRLTFRWWPPNTAAPVESGAAAARQPEIAR